jgi:hypothetical protein
MPNQQEKIQESIPAIEALSKLNLREVGKKISANSMAIINQIVDLCKKLIGTSGAMMTKTAESIQIAEAYYAGTMEAIQKDIRLALDNKATAAAFCPCSNAPERADRDWSTLSLEGTGLDGTCLVSCHHCNKLWIANYSRDDQSNIVFSNIKMGAQVIVAMESNRNEEIDISESGIALAENGGMDENGIFHDACIIRPGWGTCGYYEQSGLQKEAAEFSGLQMFIDHQTPEEEAQRPERTLTTLAGVTANTIFKENGWKGPAVYGDIKVFSDHQQVIAEKAPYIGLSIFGRGRGRIGEVDGRKGKIIESIPYKRSVDFVTIAGAGGALMPLLESARGGQNNRKENTKQYNLETMSIEELKEARPDLFTPDGSIKIDIKENGKGSGTMGEENKELQTLRETVTTLQEANQKQSAVIMKLTEKDIIRESSLIAAGLIREAKVPEITKKRLTTTCVFTPLNESGELDAAKVKEQVNAAIAEAEAEYAAIVGAGKITGMGGGGNDPVTVKESIQAQMDATFGLKPLTPAQ